MSKYKRGDKVAWTAYGQAAQKEDIVDQRVTGIVDSVNEADETVLVYPDHRRNPKAKYHGRLQMLAFDTVEHAETAMPTSFTKKQCMQALRAATGERSGWDYMDPRCIPHPGAANLKCLKAAVRLLIEDAHLVVCALPLGQFVRISIRH